MRKVFDYLLGGFYMSNIAVMSGTLIISMIPKTILYVMEIYTLFLGIKALRIYIDKNS